MLVPVVAVVQAGQTTEIGGGLVRGDGTLVVSGYGSDIVVERRKGQFPEIKKERGHIRLCKDAGLLQITVR